MKSNNKSNNKKIFAIYPGSFDPLTLGHLDIIKRSIKLVDKLIIAIGNNSDKKHKSFFTNEEKIDSITECIKNDSFLSLKVINVQVFNGLLIDFAKKQNANVIIRGLRALSDFDFEFNLASSNQVLSPEIESIFLMTSVNKQFISSRIVKEIFMLGGDISKFVAPSIKKKMELKKFYRV